MDNDMLITNFKKMAKRKDIVGEITQLLLDELPKTDRTERYFHFEKKVNNIIKEHVNNRFINNEIQTFETDFKGIEFLSVLFDLYKIETYKYFNNYIKNKIIFYEYDYFQKVKEWIYFIVREKNRFKCSKCGEVIIPEWVKTNSVVYLNTVYSCINKDETSVFHDVGIYINHCWKCKTTSIDSRKNIIKVFDFDDEKGNFINGGFLCRNCGAGNKKARSFSCGEINPYDGAIIKKSRNDIKRINDGSKVKCIIQNNYRFRLLNYFHNKYNIIGIDNINIDKQKAGILTAEEEKEIQLLQSLKLNHPFNCEDLFYTIKQYDSMNINNIAIPILSNDEIEEMEATFCKYSYSFSLDNFTF